MSSILNASASGGLVTQGDASATLELQSDGTTKFTVASTGAYGTLQLATAKAWNWNGLTTNTFLDFTVPSWAKRVTVLCGDISSNGTSLFQILLNGEVTGYTSAVGRITPINFSSGASSTAGWLLTAGNNAASNYSGTAFINLLNPSTNQYAIVGNMNQNDGASSLNYFTGTKSLSAVLNTIRVTTASPSTNTFDAGTVNIMYEG